MHSSYRWYPPLFMDKVMEMRDAYCNNELEPLNFCQAVSSFNPFDYVDVCITREDLKAATAYGDITGGYRLRQAICRYYQDQFDYEVSPRQVCVTVGASEALAVAFAMLVEKGGEVILAESHFPPYRILAHMFGGQCRYAPLNDKQCLDVAQLPDLITPKTRAIVVNSPSNPHGTVLSKAELNTIAALGVPIIFDEVYQSLGFTDEPIASAISCPGQHIIVNSFSKSLALAGFRIGYLIVPEEQVELMINVKATMDFSTSVPLQSVCEVLLDNWDYLIDKHRQLLTHNWQHFKQVANALGLKLLSEPKAGHFGIIDVSMTRRDSATIAIELAKNCALYTAPGMDFQINDPGFLRFNFACPTKNIAPGLRRLAAYLNDRHYVTPSPIAQAVAHL